MNATYVKHVPQDQDSTSHVITQVLWRTDTGEYYLSSHADISKLLKNKRMCTLMGYTHEIMVFPADKDGTVRNYGVGCVRAMKEPPSHPDAVQSAGFTPKGYPP